MTLNMELKTKTIFVNVHVSVVYSTARERKYQPLRGRCAARSCIGTCVRDTSGRVRARGKTDTGSDAHLSGNGEDDRSRPNIYAACASE